MSRSKLPAISAWRKPRKSLKPFDLIAFGQEFLIAQEHWCQHGLRRGKTDQDTYRSAWRYAGLWAAGRAIDLGWEESRYRGVISACEYVCQFDPKPKRGAR